MSQLLSYGSYLEALSDEELVELIQAKSGTNGIDRIEDFEAWYGERIGRPWENLRPLRMVLVGLGADGEARRIVEFLQGYAVRIELLTFHGFRHKDTTILAVQAEAISGNDDKARTFRPRPAKSQEELLRSLEERAKASGLAGVWADAFTEMRIHSDSHYAKESGITFSRYAPHLDLGGRFKVRAPFSLNLEANGRIRVTFFPAAVHLCRDEFAKADTGINFERQTPSNAPTTAGVAEEWFSLLDEEGWGRHRDALLTLCKNVAEAWAEARKNA